MGGQNDPFLASGDVINLLPVTGGRPIRGTVVEAPVRAAPSGPLREQPADAGPRGPVRVDALPRAGRRMHGTRVWVIRGPDGPGTVAAFAARLRVPGPSSLLELVDLALLADEPRRTAVRAAARRPILLLHPGKVSSGTFSLDLSSTGCRVVIPPDERLATGQAVQVAVGLDGGAPVWADGEVVWVDEDGRVAALRFTRVDPADAERLERGVMAELAPPHPRP